MESIPPLQTGKSVWRGPAMEQRKEEWVHHLLDAEVNELENAAESFISSEAEIGSMNPRHFPLPNFRTKLLEIRNKLIHGIGFTLIRGLPINRYNENEVTTIFYGIGTHIGNARSQNAAGHVLGHVRDFGEQSNDPNVRLYQTNARQSFHTDSSDVVALLCIQPAKEGGSSILVSSDTVFNEMREHRPDLLAILLEPIATDRRGEIPLGMLPYLMIPVFSYFSQRVTPFYQRQYIESAQRFEGVPELTSKQIEALDYFDKLCNSQELNLSMNLEKGDIQLVYNHALLHDRTSFVDLPEGPKRHLLRLWLSVPGDRNLPEIFSSRFGSVEVGNRGGIVVPGSKLTIPAFSNYIQ